MIHIATSAEHARIAEAIRKAEAKTSGEIYCVVTRQSDSYFYPAAVTVLVTMLIVSLGCTLLLETWWYTVRLPLFVFAQILAASAMLVILALFPGLRVWLVPRRLQFLRAHSKAVTQFLSRNVHLTAERTGVLIFVSLAERYAEVVADSGINSKVNQSDWNDIVAHLIEHCRNNEITDGFVHAVEETGNLLAEHFPPRPHNPNELDDHLIEI